MERLIPLAASTIVMEGHEGERPIFSKVGLSFSGAGETLRVVALSAESVGEAPVAEFFILATADEELRGVVKAASVLVSISRKSEARKVARSRPERGPPVVDFGCKDERLRLCAWSLTYYG